MCHVEPHFHIHLSDKLNIRVIHKYTHSKITAPVTQCCLKSKANHYLLKMALQPKKCYLCSEHHSRNGVEVRSYFFFPKNSKYEVSFPSFKTTINPLSDSIIQMKSALQSESCLLTKAAV